MRMRAGLLAGLMLVATAVAAAAQAPYQPPPAAAYLAPATPPSWSWDPYTSGLGPCVQQNWGNSPPCRDFMEPTYGQPNYWNRR
jgi:hypothetical protein